ncbi:hypothetical protein CRENPOLYSF2_30008 [Crenothrix polyspora]|uniref:Uncharacterized protein n=1 Tax=Crenothrix polyspora TaxID=360316 RepID=A0A1R4HA71_9GAMM|nr:hypothetical protein CRENPOLYSF2_30008 [Crenothrix polyspora]
MCEIDALVQIKKGLGLLITIDKPQAHSYHAGKMHSLSKEQTWAICLYVESIQIWQQHLSNKRKQMERVSINWYLMY